MLLQSRDVARQPHVRLLEKSSSIAFLLLMALLQSCNQDARTLHQFGRARVRATAQRSARTVRVSTARSPAALKQREKCFRKSQMLFPFADRTEPGRAVHFTRQAFRLRARCINQARMKEKRARARDITSLLINARCVKEKPSKGDSDKKWRRDNCGVE